jgi:threonine synthase
MSLTTSSRYTLICSHCGFQFDPAKIQTYCELCNSPILTQYNLDELQKILNREQMTRRPRGIWRWRELLPVNDEKFCITLGEGDTPIIPLENLGGELHCPAMFLKDESINATGTFKARGMAVAISKAMELGLREFVIPTAGNAGGALASYAARSGCIAHVSMPLDTPEANKIEVQLAGADLHLVDGLINDAAKLAHDDAVKNNWFDVSTFKEPFRVEGKKTMGFEIAQSFDWQLPDVIIYPTGGGTGLVGMWKAFEELESLGWIGSKRPRMVSVQAEGCAPIVNAFRTRAEQTEFWLNAKTIASGLRVPGVFADRLVLKTLRESEGTAVTVSDWEILDAQKELSSKEGVFSCPEGAATLAAFKILLQQGWIKKNEQVILFNTGTGLKYI